MNELEDIKLQALLQSMNLESPKPNFSVRVMNKIFEENSAIEKLKAEKVFGKGFWIIMILFVVLLAAVFILNNKGISAESQVQNLLPEASSRVSESYQSIFSKLGSLPLAMGAIFAAFSILIFIDRLISSNSKIFAS